MTIEYHVYANNGSGGPIDMSTVVATVTGLTWTSPSLALGSDTTYLVRAFDSVSGAEEKNLTALVRIHLDSSGNDLGVLPNAPTDLSVQQTSSGLVVSWVYARAGQGSQPTGFKVWLSSGAISYSSSPTATVAYRNGGAYAVFSTTIATPLTDGTAYHVGVRAYSGSGTEQNTNTLTFTAVVNPPANVDGLTATATTQSPG